jgi:uncharacterized membrane protein YfhO
MEIQTESDHNAFLVYSENHFPGWQAQLDGQPVTLYRTNGTLLGVPTPAGKHRIVLTFKPVTLYLALLGSLIALSILIGLVFVAMRTLFRRRMRS